MARRLRVGVIGLGQRWRRHYRAALLGLCGDDRPRVRAVFDPRPRRAEREARALGCRAADSLTALLEAEDVEAVLMPDAPWFHLWPLEQAARLGKPFFLGDLSALADPAADALAAQVRQRQLPTGAALLGRVTPAYRRLRELLETRLGPVRAVIGETAGPSPGGEAAPLVGGPRPDLGGLTLVDSCIDLFGGEPAPGAEPWRWDGGRSAHLLAWHAPNATPRTGFRVVAERGTAWVLFPRRLSWADGPVRRSESFAAGSPHRALLEQFVGAARGDRPPGPGFADAARAAALLRPGGPLPPPG
jgi:predicted dehydrogenase